MIKYLQEDYLNHFKLTRPECKVHSTALNGLCALYDSRSCNPCISNGRQQCDANSFKQIFLLETKSPVDCVNIDEFLSQFSGTKAEPRNRCDLMLYDNSKIAFVEMYCGQEKYIHPYETTHKSGRVEKKIGKLATVRQQITVTLDKLCEVPSIESKINTFQERLGLFGFRRKNGSKEMLEQGQGVENNINIFIRTAEAASEGGYTMLPHGFKFSVVTYPDVYVW